MDARQTVALYLTQSAALSARMHKLQEGHAAAFTLTELEELLLFRKPVSA